MKMRRPWWVLAMALGCAAPRAAETPPPHPVAVAPAPAEAPRQPEPPPAVALVEASVTPIDTGLGDAPVVGWPVDVATAGQPSVVLFPDELAALRAAVAQGLAKRGIATVPVAELARIETAAAEGVLVLEDDRRCASPLTRAEVRARYFAANPEVEIAAACWDSCRLTVTVRTSPDPIIFTSAPVRHPEDPERWRRAALELADEVFGSIGLGLTGVSPAPPVRFGPPGWVGPWRTPPAESQLAVLEERASGCAHPVAGIGLRYGLRATVDRSGRIARCEADSSDGYARASDASCLCGVLGELQLDAGSSKRRLWVEAIDDGSAPSIASGLAVLQPGTDVWVERVKDSLAFERCALGRARPSALDAVVALRLAADGSVEDVRIDAPLDAAAMGWAHCVVDQLGALALPCRPPGIDVLRARLVIPGP